MLQRSKRWEALPQDHPRWRLVDRRIAPSHGYRAVHLIRQEGPRRVEFQLRTRLQHSWAELAEAMDRLHTGIKYGDGPPYVVRQFGQLSQFIAGLEQSELWVDPAGRHMIANLREQFLEIMGALHPQRRSDED